MALRMQVLGAKCYVRLGRDTDLLKLRSLLTYHDKKVDYQIRQLKKARWMVAKYGQDEVDARLAALKASQKKCILFPTTMADGLEDRYDWWTYAGLVDRIESHCKLLGIEYVIERDLDSVKEATPLPWVKIPPPLYPYQKEAFEALWGRKHSSVEMGTGTGKSRIIEQLVRDMGKRTVVMAPTANIARALYNRLQKSLGKGRVGLYGDGRKDFKKLITVGIHASLTRIERGSEVWDELSKTEVFIADESHMTPAESLEKVCVDFVRTLNSVGSSLAPKPATTALS